MREEVVLLGQVVLQQQAIIEKLESLYERLGELRDTLDPQFVGTLGRMVSEQLSSIEGVVLRIENNTDRIS